MNTSRALWALLAASVCVPTGSARADVAPADACTMPGQPCHNAGLSGFMIGAEQCGKAGTCSTAKCTRVGPISGGASGDGDNDGGVRIGTITYDCYRCIASDPTSPQPTGGFGSNCEPLSSGSGSDHGGCSAVTTDVDSSLAAVIGAGVLLLLRRRKVR